MVLTISDEEFVRMKTAALDGDKQEALSLIREFVKRLELETPRTGCVGRRAVVAPKQM